MFFQVCHTLSFDYFSITTYCLFLSGFSSKKLTFSSWKFSFRIIELNRKSFIRQFIFSAMTEAAISRFQFIHHKAAMSFSRGRMYGGQFSRSLSAYAAPLITPNASCIVCPPSSLALAARITQSDVPQRSEEWFRMRRDRLTTSTFSTALGFWKGTRRIELWQEKVFTSEAQTAEAAKLGAMEWGVLNEATAINSYKSITGREVGSLGFAIHSSQQFDWIGASPDGVLGCFPEGGILEVKCPFNKGKPEVGLPWKAMPFYYMPQVQGQLEIMNREWADLYCWTPNGSTIFRVHRDRDYWQLIHGILREFWWEHVVPAREALLLGREEDAVLYKPTATHKLTGFVIVRSSKLATESKLLCREIAGHVEFYR